MALDLKQLERKLHEALANETPMSLYCWLKNERELQRIKPFRYGSSYSEASGTMKPMAMAPPIEVMK